MKKTTNTKRRAGHDTSLSSFPLSFYLRVPWMASIDKLLVDVYGQGVLAQKGGNTGACVLCAKTDVRQVMIMGVVNR